MNKEMLFLVEQFKDAFRGDPWFGRSVVELLNDVNENIAFEKPNGQHSILELVWHMIIWKEYVIHCLQPQEGKSLSYFEERDWRKLDHADKSLFKKGVVTLLQVQDQLLDILQSQQDGLFEETVPNKKISFRRLLYGVLQHDIYHLGQIAYVNKLLAK